MAYLDRLRREARHEAAHAVIAEVLGIEVVHVEMATPATRLRVRSWPSYDERRRRAVQVIAGNASEGSGHWTRRGHSPDDRAAFRDLLATLPTDTPGHLWALAHRLVRRHDAAIGRVAAALLDADVLEGDDVRRLLCP